MSQNLMLASFVLHITAVTDITVTPSLTIQSTTHSMSDQATTIHTTPTSLISSPTLASPKMCDENSGVLKSPLVAIFIAMTVVFFISTIILTVILIVMCMKMRNIEKLKSPVGAVFPGNAD